MKPAYIYALTDPRTGEVRYVGKSVNLRVRFRHHVNGRSETRCSRWIRSLRGEGLRPVLFILEGPCEDWDEAERRWIAFYRAEGANLTNGTNGGQPGLTEAAREAHAIAMARPEVGKKISGALKGRELSPEHRAAIGAGNRRFWNGKSRLVTPETRAKIAASNRVGTPEVRAKISATLRARYAADPRLQAKMSADRKGKPWSPARRAAQASKSD